VAGADSVTNLNDFEVTASDYGGEVGGGELFIRHKPCGTESGWMQTPIDLSDLAFWATDHFKECPRATRAVDAPADPA
jgi:hypothetical protein